MVELELADVFQLVHERLLDFFFGCHFCVND
jgi:hypothetical protein